MSVGAGERGRSRKRGASGGAASSPSPPPKPRRPAAKPKTPEALLAALAERDRDLAERDRDLAEARERQTATSEILRVIAASPSDAQPVFDAIAESSKKLIGARAATVTRVIDGMVHLVAQTGFASKEAEAAVRALYPRPYSESVYARVEKAGEPLEFPNVASMPPYLRDLFKHFGPHFGASFALVPMTSLGRVLGVIAVLRNEEGALPAHQVQLLQTFADQAVIAIENARLFNETQEALERQTATSDVLKVISRSVSDAAPVFETILDSCRRLLGVERVAVNLVEGDMVRGVAQRGFDGTDFGRDLTPLAGSMTSLAIVERRAVHFPDLADRPDLPEHHRASVRQGGGLTVLYAPMLTEGGGIGSIVVSRAPKRPFTDKEIALAQSFADQAAIAIQNARLFKETEEALGQQTATSEILRVISQSPTDARPVFGRIVQTAARVLGCDVAAIMLCEGSGFRVAAVETPEGQPAGFGDMAVPLDPAANFPSRAILAKEMLHLPDWSRIDLPEGERGIHERLGVNSTLYLPLLREGDCIGALTLAGRRANIFGPKEIAQAESFRDQAVIAIENARLFAEVQARTRDLEESLAQQTATADVLKVISRSAFDLDVAALAILEAAARLCRATQATLHLRDGDVCRLVTQFGLPEAFEREARANPIPIRYPLHARRTPRAGEIGHFADAWTDPDYLYKSSARLGGYRAIVVIPLMREGELVGIFSLGRPAPEPFTESQIKLTQTFADQAAIAIQNARLFAEVQEALQRETATSEILRVISRSPTDARPVFDAIVLAAVRALRCEGAFVLLRDGDGVDTVAGTMGQGLLPQLPGRTPLDAAHNFPARAILSGETLHVPDWSVADLPGHEKEIRAAFGINCGLWLPLMRDSECVGVIGVGGTRPNMFGPKEIAQAESFRDQAMIAIENARLFNETQEALERQTATAEILRVISQSPTDARPVFESIVLTAVRVLKCDFAGTLLCDGDSFYAAASATAEGLREHFDPPFRIPIDRTANFPSRAILDKATLHLPDWSLIELPPHERVVQDQLGAKSALYMPLMREDECIGVLGLVGNRPHSFGPKESAQAESFRDQAMIAVENARLFDEVQAKTRDLEESLAQQTATADVLKAISRSAFDLDTVLDTLISTAVRLCDATHGQIFRRHGDVYRYAASQMDVDPAYREHERATEIRAGRGTLMGRVALENRTVEIADAWSDPDYAEKDEARLGDVRAMLGVPLMRDGEPIGAFALARREAGAYTPRQIELVQTFADQAVIAIENARLFNEVQAKTRDLEESLAQQTATAEVLKVISRSTFDVQAVLTVLVESARELCGAPQSMILLSDGSTLRMAKQVGFPEAFERYVSGKPPAINPTSGAGRAVHSRQVVHFPDVLSDESYRYSEGQKLGGYRALLSVPLLRGADAIGVFSLGRPSPVGFTDRQIELVKTFADQAVIAIENARLFGEVQAKTRDLEEALAQQTATADVLKVISRSAFDLDAVLKTLADSARSLSGAALAGVFLRVGDVMQIRAESGCPPEFLDYMVAHPLPPSRETMVGRVTLTGEFAHIPDVLTDPEYNYGNAPALGRYRAVIGVPLRISGRVDGVFGLMHPSPGAFTPRQIELARTFADQAVIAIENARLIGEVQARTRDLEESLAQQTATADVLKVISRSAFDLGPVLQTLVESAAKLCDAEMAVITREIDGVLYRAESYGCSEKFMTELRLLPVLPNRGTVSGRALIEGKAVQIEDVEADEEYTLKSLLKIDEFHTCLGIPMLRNGVPIGIISLLRRAIRMFDGKQIELVQTFADQAVIAIENARLFNEVQAKTRDLEESLAQQTATADVLKVISRSAFDLGPVLRALVETAAKLCEAEKATITREIGGVFFRAESYGFSDDFMADVQRLPVVPDRGTISGRVLLEGKAVQVEDVRSDPGYRFVAGTEIDQFRTCLGVPMLREATPIGVLALVRSEVRPFTEKQIALVQTFADQAAIAIENARLFAEVQAKTHDVEEALEDQIATSGVLQAIGASMADAQPVFARIVDSLANLMPHDLIGVWLTPGDGLMRIAAHRAVRPFDFEGIFPAPVGQTALAVADESAQQFELADVLGAPAAPPTMRAIAERHGNFAVLITRMAWKGRLIGTLGVTRAPGATFTERERKLLSTFADQAVIAIENARLFSEVQAKTHDLEESLAQQTATADVLKVISRSAFDLQSVLDTLISSAVQLNGAQSGAICVREGDAFAYRAFASLDGPQLANYLRVRPAVAGRGSMAGRVILSGEVEQVADVLADPEYHVPLGAQGSTARALIGVPLIGKDRLEGVFILSRLAPGAYAPRQVEILKTFADQAVIAIENSRLFDEVQARTRELAASLDDLRKAQDRLIQSEKLASLGQLTAGIAHEIKNPLNFINNFSALSRELMDELREVLDKSPNERADHAEADELIGMIDANLDKVVAHGKRADSIVKNMLLHSREGSGERGPVNVNAMVEEALNLAYHGARAEKRGFNVTIEKALDPAAGEAVLYHQEMTRVLLNLISNGFYATTKRKEAQTDAGYEPTIFAATRNLGHAVEIVIRDNGTGIPDDVKAKMFNPFFTTKPAGEGTGLGLSLSHDIVVKQHGGTVEVATEPGAYTAFTITLPRGGRGP
jgi:GAF domain-containing protein